MICSLVGYPIRGNLVQIESNHTGACLREEESSVGGWRQLWDWDFPFTTFKSPFNTEENPSTPEFWESQEAVEQLSNTAMVVINDIATLQDIHPPNKQDVGKRLAGFGTHLRIRICCGKTHHEKL